MAVFEGLGDFEEFIEVWDGLLIAFEHQTTIQNQSMSGIASTGLRAGSWEFELGT